ncbi:MAG TPA: 5'-methylthioadenosine/S-adenosylhomocysteine nucleosidase [Aliidongia sp.]|nr:5'-methylthioadenosine/S-adenosylhomocysteine nucleosidase [Aliidongia sp.]
MKFPSFVAVSAALFSFFTGSAAMAAETLDTVPRTAIMSAFPPEWTALQAALQDRKDYPVGGTVFATGTIEGKPVLLFLSGVSMVNAAMTTQLALDRFSVARIVFSGVAGGADPSLDIGDVVVPEAWSEYLQSVFAREKVGGGYALPSFADKPLANDGMIFPQPAEVSKEAGKVEKHFWFAADPQLLAIAKTVASTVVLKDCTADNKCLARKPKIVVGGHGVSGQAFVDNKAFREYAHKIFEARVIDEESAAVAHVAYADGIPFIAFRSLSDLAGGGPGENEIGTFLTLASDNSASVVEAFLKALPYSIESK